MKMYPRLALVQLFECNEVERGKGLLNAARTNSSIFMVIWHFWQLFSIPAFCKHNRDMPVLRQAKSNLTAMKSWSWDLGKGLGLLLAAAMEQAKKVCALERDKAWLPGEFLGLQGATDAK